MTPQELGLLTLRDNLEIFSANCLKVKDKSGVMQPLIFNRAQRYVHDRLEQQRRETGKVRAIILKGRQQGMSTYVGARFYHATTMRQGQTALIVAHEQKATDNLFKMVRRFHDYNPLPVSTGNTNAKELIFDRLQGGYVLATAGTKDVGRGQTAQLAHLSEYGFWQNAQSHMAGLGNIVSDMDGTEIIIESTANGLGNAFHETWQDAEIGKGDFIAIFVPFFWQEEYRAPVRNDLVLDEGDLIYQSAYGLDAEQMQWRRNKIVSYGDDYAWLFSQEFPATPSLAFRTSTMNPLINPSAVMAAVNGDYLDLESPLVIGCDPAGDGEGKADRTAIAFRSGRTCFRIEYHDKLSTMQVAGKLAEYWTQGVTCNGRQLHPDAMFVDKGGLGSGIVDRLLELNIPVMGVSFAQQASKPDIYLNKRAEIWWTMRDWVKNNPCRLPNDAALISDMCAPQPVGNSLNKKQLESKKEMAKRQIRSPDGGDALALTFSEPVAPRSANPGRMTASRPATSAGY